MVSTGIRSAVRSVVITRMVIQATTFVRMGLTTIQTGVNNAATISVNPIVMVMDFTKTSTVASDVVLQMTTAVC